jgi:hypothetical protein
MPHVAQGDIALREPARIAIEVMFFSPDCVASSRFSPEAMRCRSFKRQVSTLKDAVAAAS